MAGTAVFDINETTLDLAPVRAVVDELVAEEGGFRVWFSRLLHLSMTVTAAEVYQDFGTLAADALHAVAATGGRRLDEEAWPRVAAAMGALQAYPDVVGGLTALRDGGWTTVALTNSAPATVNAQLTGAGIAPLFDHILSVDAVRAFKPSAAPYRHASEVVGAEPSSMWMVACHDWDLAGARTVGLRTAYVRRPGMSYAGAFAPPDLDVAGFDALATALLAT